MMLWNSVLVYIADGAMEASLRLLDRTPDLHSCDYLDVNRAWELWHLLSCSVIRGTPSRGASVKCLKLSCVIPVPALDKSLLGLKNATRI